MWNFLGLRCNFPFQNVGSLVFIPIPKSWEFDFSFPRPIPKVGIYTFYSHYQSQKLGTGLAISHSQSQLCKSHSCSCLPLRSLGTSRTFWYLLDLKVFIGPLGTYWTFRYVMDLQVPIGPLGTYCTLRYLLGIFWLIHHPLLKALAEGQQSLSEGLGQRPESP